MSSLLHGVRVVDLSRVLAGPFGAQVMAEMGADVIKVETGSGDPARSIGPFLDGRSLYFSSLNTGKRGVYLNLSTEAGRAALDALIAGCDVLVENFRPSTGRRLGLDPETLLRRHPRLVAVSVVGHARESDRVEEGAFDLTIQAETGIMAVTGEPGRPPVRAGVPLSDLTAGLWAALGAVAALLARDRDGRGRHVEIPMVDATLPLLCYMATSALGTGQEPPKVGSGHHRQVPYGAFPTSDGWIAVGALEDKFWPPLCRALGLDDLLARSELAHNDGRLERREEVEARIAETLNTLTTDEAAERLRTTPVPHAPVLGIIEALGTPYVRSRGLVAEVRAPEGTYRVARGPLRAPAEPRPAPRRGEHTREVLAEVLGADSPLIREVLAAT
ncbi:MAG: CaiB/BaiF CoA transferase family protein [Actinomycetota bacterium]